MKWAARAGLTVAIDGEVRMEPNGTPRSVTDVDSLTLSQFNPPRGWYGEGVTPGKGMYLQDTMDSWLGLSLVADKNDLIETWNSCHVKSYPRTHLMRRPDW